MRCRLLLLVCLCLAAPRAQAQLLLTRAGGATLGGAASNIVLVNSTAGTSDSGTSYAVTIPSTGAGNGLIIIQEDADNPIAPGVPTGVTGSTCVTDGTFAQTNNEGRQTYFNCPNISAGTTSVTLHVATSGHSAVNIREYSGLKTTSLLDSIVAAKTATTATTTQFSSTLTTTQTDLAVTSCTEGSVATSNMAAGTGWGNGKKFVQAADLTDSYAADMLNIQGQITGILTGDSHNYTCILALYKSAVAGTALTGNTPSFYVDFENGANGATITSAVMAAATHGGSCTWTVTGGGSSLFSISTSAERALVQNTSVNGTTYTAPDSGTRGSSMDTSGGGVSATCTWAAGSNATTASAGMWWHSPAAQDTLTTYSLLTIGGSGAGDFVTPAIAANTNAILCETGGGDSIGSITYSFNTWYMVAVQYVAGGTHSCALYDTSGTQVGSTVTHAATGSFAPVNIQIGQSHGAAGNAGNVYFEENVQVDYMVGTFPIKQ